MNRTALYHSLFHGYDDITNLLFENKNLHKSIKEETMKKLQEEGGGEKSIKLLKMMKGEIFGEKVEKSTQNYSKSKIISDHFITTIKKQENNKGYELIFKSINKAIIKLIESYKPISNDLLMMILHNKDDENSEILLNKLELIISEILNPLKFDEIKWTWFNEYLLNSSSSIWFISNKKNELFYSLIEKRISQYEKEILSVKMKDDIIKSKIIEEKEEWSLVNNNDNNYEINKRYL